MKKSLNIILHNPDIPLIFVLFLLVFQLLLPFLFAGANKYVFYSFSAVLFLFSCAFMAGWFGVIKSSVENTCEQKNFLAPYNHFLASVGKYFFAVVFFAILSILLLKGFYFLTDTILPPPMDAINNFTKLPDNQDVLMNYLSTLSEESKIILFKRSILLMALAVISSYLSMFFMPALYFSDSANPVIAIKNGLLALVKKPLLSIGLFSLILFCHLFLMVIETLSLKFAPLAFIMFVVRICFICTVIVLVFLVYAKNFTDNCNNGGDSLGENEP